jgi:HEPN domain-containing protein
MLQSDAVNRWRDWWEQAARDLGHAHHSVDAGDYEWASFAAHQAAEKALKSILMKAGGEPWGHSLTTLAEEWSTVEPGATAVLDAARRLDKHYLPARYPNGFPEGHPGKLYTRGEALDAISDATAIVELCRRQVP